MVLVLVLVVYVVVFVDAVLGLVVVIVGPRNITLKFGTNWVSNCLDVVVMLLPFLFCCCSCCS